MTKRNDLCPLFWVLLALIRPGTPPGSLPLSSPTMLRNMLDGDGQDQYDAGGWCFPKPIPPVQRNGEWTVMEPLGQVKCNEAFEKNLREYPGEKVPKKKKEWQSVQGGSILTICKLHPSQRPPMVRPEDVLERLNRSRCRHGWSIQSVDLSGQAQAESSPERRELRAR